MARPLRIQYPNAFYHVTCRGNARTKIFLKRNDCARFLSLLAQSLETYHVVLHSYILMNNHFHLLIQTPRANLSEFMRHFNICYTGWFNYHHGRCGHLYQGRYKALLVDVDNYLLEVSRYLHLNCVRVRGLGAADYQWRWQYVTEYQWSSLPGYLNEKKVEDFINYDLILSMVGGRRPYRDFMLDGLKHDINNPFEEVKSGLILGSEDFAARVKSDYAKGGSLRDQPSYRSLSMNVVEPDVVIDCVVMVLGINKQRLLVRFGAGVERGIVSELLYRYSGMTQKKIGELLGGIDYSAVNKLRRRIQKRMTYDKQIAAQYMETERKIKELMSNVEI